jgi:CRP/FNR family transcriptional regulator
MSSTAVRAAVVNPSCRDTVRCTASDLLRWAGMMGHVDGQTDGIHFPVRRVRAAKALVHEGQPFDTLYVVSGGSFKAVQTDLEGFEQVLGFAMHGDFIGLDGLGQSQHTTGAVALEDSTVVALEFRDLLAWGHRVPALESLLHRAAGDEVLRRGDTQYLMSAPSSEVRVVRFLLQTARRQAALGYSERVLRLRMTRRDIGSYLGVAHETVSRALTALAVDGCIRILQRDIELSNLPALRELQRLTRGRSSHDRHARIHQMPLRQGEPLLAAIRAALH